MIKIPGYRRTKSFKVLLFKRTLLLLFLVSTQSGIMDGQNPSNPKNNTGIATNNIDSLQLTVLIRNMYSWASRNDSIYFAPVLIRDRVYTGIDWDAQQKALKLFEDSHFFSPEFIKNLRRIAVYQDSIMRFGREKWNEDQLPPYPEADSDPWCDCQDNTAFRKLKVITNLKVMGDIASFAWKADDDFTYEVKAVRVNKKWKISWLQGFDIGNYMITDSGSGLP
jgi:hypothetical protein